MNNFGNLTRVYTLLMSASPFFIALCCAVNAQIFPDFHFFINALLIFIGIILTHMSANLFDDYIDVKTELNKGIPLNQINFDSKRKAAAILDGTYSIEQVEKILITMISVACIIGIYFIFIRSELILTYMLITAILGFIYPSSSKYGMAELIIAVVFGPLLINGSYYALTGQADPQVFNISIASGLITVVLAIAHSIMDYEHDIQVNKKTIPVLLKDKNLAVNFISLLILLSWGIIFYTCKKYGMSDLILLSIILTIPVGIKLITSLYEYIQIKDVKFIPKWYYGSMEDLDIYAQNNFAYFMFRFYLARNLAVIFNMTIAIVCLFFYTPLRSFDFNFLRFVSQYFTF